MIEKGKESVRVVKLDLGFHEGFLFPIVEMVYLIIIFVYIQRYSNQDRQRKSTEKIRVITLPMKIIELPIYNI